MIESIRKEKRPVLLLDCGAVFNPQVDPANAELQLKAMERMGYNALNLGIPELLYGKDFLERSRSQVSFPYIASNLLYGGVRPSWVKEYAIQEVGGIKVAILGILEPEDLKHIPGPNNDGGFSATPPRATLERLVPEVRAKADIVVLLTQLGEIGEKKTRALAEAVPGIDVAIMSEKNYAVQPPEKTVLFLETKTRGMTMGLMTLVLDEKGTHKLEERRYIQLLSTIPDHPDILELVEAHQKGRGTSQGKQNQQLIQGPELTPEEFMERFRKELN